MAFATLRTPKVLRRPKGPKPRRRTELGLMVGVGIIVATLYALMVLGTTAKVPTDVGPLLVVLFLLAAVAHVANRVLVPDAHPVVLPLAFLLNGIGYTMIVRIDLATHGNYASLQAIWTAVGVGAYVVTLLMVRRSRDLDRYRYLLLAIGIGLLVLPMVPGIGLDIGGARLWVHVGRLQFQPVELGEILLCLFFASYFIERRELLSIPTARVGDRLVVDPRPLVPIALAWVFAVGVIGLEDDIGFAALLFALFVAMLWVATGRSMYLLIGLVAFAVAAFAASFLFRQTNIRVEDWLDPWKYAETSGYQLVQSWFALGSGGLGGVGLGLGQAWRIPNALDDFIFVVIGEEMGLLGSTVVVVAFLLLVGAGMRIAQAARSQFAKLTATGLTVIIGLQAFIIIGGIVRLVPETGITLPFVSYGGSALLSNYILIALLMRISDEGGRTGPQTEAMQRTVAAEPVPASAPTSVLT